MLVGGPWRDNVRVNGCEFGVWVMSASMQEEKCDKIVTICILFLVCISLLFSSSNKFWHQFTLSLSLFLMLPTKNLYRIDWNWRGGSNAHAWFIIIIIVNGKEIERESNHIENLNSKQKKKKGHDNNTI